jgi:hypothetical protein
MDKKAEVFWLLSEVLLLLENVLYCDEQQQPRVARALKTAEGKAVEAMKKLDDSELADIYRRISLIHSGESTQHLVALVRTEFRAR